MFISLHFTKRDLNTKQMGQSKASLSATFQNIEKLSEDFSKRRDMSRVTVAQLLEWCKYKGIVYIISLFNKKCVSLCKYIYLSAEFNNTNTTINVKGSVVYGSEKVLDTTHLMKGCVKDFSNSLDSNHQRVAFTIF